MTSFLEKKEGTESFRLHFRVECGTWYTYHEPTLLGVDAALWIP